LEEKNNGEPVMPEVMNLNKLFDLKLLENNRRSPSYLKYLKYLQQKKLELILKDYALPLSIPVALLLDTDLSAWAADKLISAPVLTSASQNENYYILGFDNRMSREDMQEHIQRPIEYTENHILVEKTDEEKKLGVEETGLFYTINGRNYLDGVDLSENENQIYY